MLYINPIEFLPINSLYIQPSQCEFVKHIKFLLECSFLFGKLINPPPPTHKWATGSKQYKSVSINYCRHLLMGTVLTVWHKKIIDKDTMLANAIRQE